MDIEIFFEEGKKVNARLGKHIIKTDQPVYGGGDDSAPAPFDYFLASLGTCAGIFVKAFCDRRGIDSSQVKLVQKHEIDRVSHRITGIDIKIELPDNFPDKYRQAVISAANQCSVKRVIADPPRIDVSAV